MTQGTSNIGGALIRVQESETIASADRASALKTSGKRIITLQARDSEFAPRALFEMSSKSMLDNLTGPERLLRRSFAWRNFQGAFRRMVEKHLRLTHAFATTDVEDGCKLQLSSAKARRKEDH